jgi:hypothetical protein
VRFVSRHPDVAAKRPSTGDGIQVGYCRLGHSNIPKSEADFGWRRGRLQGAPFGAHLRMTDQTPVVQPQTAAL